MPRLRGLLPWCALAALLACLQGGAVWAKPGLLVRDLRFEQPIRRLKLMDWEGRPALLVLTVGATPTPREPRPPYDLSLVRLQNGALTEIGRWKMPPELRWVEPIALGGGRQGLWALIGAGWYVGRIEGAEVRWRLLCRCDSLFAAGKELLPFEASFARDLDGDGRDEVLLPHWRGLMVYRLTGEGTVLQPLWRDQWEVHENYNVSDESMKVTITVPRFVLKDANGDGVLDFVLIGDNALEVVLHPAPDAPEGGTYYVTDRDKLTELHRLNLPASLRKALHAMKQATYSNPAAFRAALRKAAKDSGTEGWAPRMEEVLAIYREPIPARFPYRVAVPRLKAPGNKEKHRIHTVADMNGDGVLDLVHMKSTDEGELLDQKNQLRWYEGQPERHGVVFRKEPQIFFSEGPAFAELVYPQVDGAAPPVLFLATTEVSLMAIIRAFTLNEVSLDLFVYPWREGRLVAPPPLSGSLLFELKGSGKKNRPMLLLADLNGDGKREFLFNMETDSLAAYAGGPEGPAFDAEPLVRQKVELPRRPDTIFVWDLDGDGREELVLWYLRSPVDSTQQRTLRVLQYGELPAAQ